jgi:hypothetical protein
VTGFDEATAVADAVLYEGYLLYPYRASSSKNRLRFQFGVLVPPSAVAVTAEEPWSRTECLCEPRAGATLTLRLRFLHLQERQIFDAVGEPCERLTVAGEDYLTWEEAVERQIDAAVPLASGSTVIPVCVPTSSSREVLGDAGVIVRKCYEISGEIRVTVTELPGPYGAVRLQVTVANTSGVPTTDRAGALRHAFIGAHSLLAIDGGTFLSMTDPPEWARGLVAECENIRTWPVLVGGDMTMLSSPIILGDHPSIAPESPGPLFDGLEIDEILTLRTMTLTDDEKRQARATDARARAIIDRSDAMPPELLDRLHGTVRYLRQVTASSESETPWWDPAADESVDPDTDSVIVDGVAVAKGSRVLLAPRLSGSDAQDMFLAGLSATVQAVISDVDGSQHIAVTVDDDPAAELQHLQGRFRYFDPTEVKPVRA